MNGKFSQCLLVSPADISPSSTAAGVRAGADLQSFWSARHPSGPHGESRLPPVPDCVSAGPPRLIPQILQQLPAALPLCFFHCSGGLAVVLAGCFADDLLLAREKEVQTVLAHLSNIPSCCPSSTSWVAHTSRYQKTKVLMAMWVSG